MTMWVLFAAKLFVPLCIAIYTINFGRWMRRRQHKAGALSAFALGAIEFGLSFYVLWRNSM